MASHADREIELKLAVDIEDVLALEARLTDIAGRPGDLTHLASVYYDTADHALRQAGVSLRVRQAGADLVQTVKMSRGTNIGFFDRSEWEVPLELPEPDLAAFGKTPAGALFASVELHVEPLFESLIDRTVWVVETASATMEFALDRGEVVAGRKHDAFAEVEIELKKGDPGDLFAMIGRLSGIDSLRPGVQVKAERGYRLARGKQTRPLKAEPVVLTKAMNTAEAFQAVMHNCLRHFLMNEPLVVEKRLPEALHQARVGLRRLRSALSLFRDVVSDAHYPTVKADLQRISRVLGDARNLDVYLAERAKPEVEGQPSEPGAAAFLQALEAQRTAAYDIVTAQLRSGAFQQVLLRLLEWIQAGDWLVNPDPLRRAQRERPVRRTAAMILGRQRRRVKRKGRHLAALDPHARHRVRIDAKKLRYAASFFESLATGPKGQRRHAAFVSALEDLQQHLGDLNDIQTAHQIAVDFAASPDGSATIPVGAFAAAHLSGAQDARVDALIESAESAYAALMATKKFWPRWRR